jgi:hypothetical protein
MLIPQLVYSNSQLGAAPRLLTTCFLLSLRPLLPLPRLLLLLSCPAGMLVRSQQAMSPPAVAALKLASRHRSGPCDGTKPVRRCSSATTVAAPVAHRAAGTARQVQHPAIQTAGLTVLLPLPALCRLSLRRTSTGLTGLPDLTLKQTATPTALPRTPATTRGMAEARTTSRTPFARAALLRSARNGARWTATSLARRTTPWSSTPRVSSAPQALLTRQHFRHHQQ